MRPIPPTAPLASGTRQLSRHSVFEALLHRSPISRAELSKVTGLSKQTRSQVIDAFEQQGLGRTAAAAPAECREIYMILYRLKDTYMLLIRPAQGIVSRWAKSTTSSDGGAAF